jgi:hypothetical protein
MLSNTARFGAPLLASVGLLLYGCQSTTLATCPVTQQQDGMLSNDYLEVSLPPSGIFEYRYGHGGEELPDGSLSIKTPWSRKVQGTLAITGRRLDKPAPPLSAQIPDGYGDIGFQATSLIFPTVGCWEVTGSLAGESLTFVMWVTRSDRG